MILHKRPGTGIIIGMTSPAHSASPHTSIEAKTCLSRAPLPDAFLVSLYRALAPYRGCAHGCAYCDGRAEKYYVEGDFARDIAVRENLAELAARDAAAGFTAREYGAICIGSGVTDVYQPLERELGLTRRTLEALAETGVPIVILTKSDLILRDFDVLARFPHALVIVTVTTVNGTDAVRLEPGASTPDRRIAVVREAKARGFSSGVMAMPLCPGISDSDESFTAVLAAAKDAGADFVYPGGLTLRPGCQKDLFLSLVDEHYPALRADYDTLYGENRQSGMPRTERSAPFHARLDRLGRQFGLAQRIPFSVYRRLLSKPDALFVLFCHMQHLYSLRGVDTRPLRAATDRYARWLSGERTALRRKRIPVVSSDPFPLTRILDERFGDLLTGTGGERSLAAILENDRLASLASAVLKDGADFDYGSLAVV